MSHESHRHRGVIGLGCYLGTEEVTEILWRQVDAALVALFLARLGGLLIACGVLPHVFPDRRHLLNALEYPSPAVDLFPLGLCAPAGEHVRANVTVLAIVQFPERL